ncbi:MAG: type 1 glutamine amidotransferase [Oscillospiraceae bacterium]|nr:type 1 glutamine amidotransferase [Oscillospiraceae bacterium]
MKPRILISGSKGKCANYENAVRHAGGEPYAFYLPKTDVTLDGLILGGGADIDPRLYKQENTASQGIDPKRDDAELALVRAYLKLGKPVLGICRGHQVINVALGGTLVQDISPSQKAFHTQDDREEDRVHPVCCKKGSVLHELYGEVFLVNSAHHQAVALPGDGLLPTAWSESGVIEAMEHKTLTVLTVQWHPERMAYDHRRSDTTDGAALFDHFICLCR